MIDLKAKDKLLYIKAEVEIVHEGRLMLLRFRLISESEQNVKDDLYKIYKVEAKITSVRSMEEGIILQDLAVKVLAQNKN